MLHYTVRPGPQRRSPGERRARSGPGTHSRQHLHAQAEQAPSVRTIIGSARTDTIQRQESSGSDSNDTPSPVGAGLKTVGSQLMKNPRFRLWLDPRLDYLRDTLWSSRSLEEKAAIIGYGAFSLGTAGFAFSQMPEMRQALSGVNIGLPLGWIPYSPIDSFSYKLPGAGSSAYGFSAGFNFDSYLELLSRHYPGNPLTGASFGLNTAYTPGEGLSVTGGKFGLKFFGGGLSATGSTFTSLSPYPQFNPGELPGEPPLWSMQSVPGMPSLQTGPGFQVMIMADFQKLITRLRGD